VPHHDDSTFLYTNPPSAIGFWFALEDCRTTNGCLSFLPGSHLLNKPIAKRFVRKQPSGEGGCTFENLVDEKQLEEESKAGGLRDWSGPRYEGQWKVEECDKGTLVLIHGSVVHRSEKNKSDKSRFIYTVRVCVCSVFARPRADGRILVDVVGQFHMIEGQAEYDNKNWLQPTPDMPFSSLFA